MKSFKIAVLPGDGIGPEVMDQALRVLQAVSNRFVVRFEISPAKVGGAAYEEFGSHLPPQTLEICQSSDAILFGSVGGPVSESHLPQWKGCETNSILALRKTFAFYANLRPVRVYRPLIGCSTLRREILEPGVDILIIRELLGDLYFGEKTTSVEGGRRVARDVATYTETQIRNVANMAFEAARRRTKRVASVDKANVLETSRLWRQVVHEVHAEYSDIELSDVLVDNCALQLVKSPLQYDVIVTSNMFGDILSDLAAVLPGSLGLTPSASINDSGFGLYEPSGGSAPDIAGTGTANPIAQILSVALMLRYSLELEEAAACIERGVELSLEQGMRTRDIAGGERAVSTAEMTDSIIRNMPECHTG